MLLLYLKDDPGDKEDEGGKPETRTAGWVRVTRMSPALPFSTGAPTSWQELSHLGCYYIDPIIVTEFTMCDECFTSV